MREAFTRKSFLFPETATQSTMQINNNIFFILLSKCILAARLKATMYCSRQYNPQSIQSLCGYKVYFFKSSFLITSMSPIILFPK